METIPPILLSEFQYELPEERIALHPSERGKSRLFVYRNGQMEHRQFGRLVEVLPENSLLIFNESKVIPARISGATSNKKAVELFLLKPAGVLADPVVALNQKKTTVWECMIGRRKEWKDNAALEFFPENIHLTATWENREKNQVRFSWSPAELPFAAVLEAVGKIPLPPYIERETEESDKETYQTVYAKTEGSVAAPTAGLHFTEDILAEIKDLGHSIDFVTLHVGAGTFLPVKTENMLEHPMHTELISVNLDTVKKIAEHRGPVIPVGTTSLRTLESLWHLGASDDFSERVEQFPDTAKHVFSMRESMEKLYEKMHQRNLSQLTAETSVMIYPGYRLHACDALITNFHQPGSTLLMLIAALIGEDWKKVYSEALRENYRFLSYGDSSLLFKK
jgi:S-adenosylmethionine:tRNA ribosyltransferase-isomerase